MYHHLPFRRKFRTLKVNKSDDIFPPWLTTVRHARDQLQPRHYSISSSKGKTSYIYRVISGSDPLNMDSYYLSIIWRCESVFCVQIHLARLWGLTSRIFTSVVNNSMLAPALTRIIRVNIFVQLEHMFWYYLHRNCVSWYSHMRWVGQNCNFIIAPPESFALVVFAGQSAWRTLLDMLTHTSFWPMPQCGWATC